MAFSVLTDHPADWSDADLYPRPGPAPRTIETDQEDGHVRSHRVTSVRVSDVTQGRTRIVTDLGDTNASLVVTGARIAIAATTRRGPMVGHVRFGWVTGILGRDRTPFVTPPTLVVGFHDPRGDASGSLLVTLAGRVSGTAMARELAAAVARHRARELPEGAGGRAALDAYARAPVGSRSGSFLRFELPDAG